jgi:hypothetical protein
MGPTLLSKIKTAQITRYLLLMNTNFSNKELTQKIINSFSIHPNSELKQP